MNQPTGKGPKKPGSRSRKADKTRNNDEKLIQVKMVNFSRGGMCFQSGHEVGSGTRITIKRLRPSAETEHPEESPGCLAEVRWCKPVSGKKAVYYRVGVEYVEPVHPKQCLEWRLGDNVCITSPLATSS